MKQIILLSSLILAVVALSSCSNLYTARLSNGKIVVIDATSSGEVQYGDQIYIDTLGKKAPYDLVGYRHPDYEHLYNSVKVTVLNEVK